MKEKAKAQTEKVPTTKKMPKFPEKRKQEEYDSKVYEEGKRGDLNLGKSTMFPRAT